jgi:predicted nucleotidyltransferase
MTQHEIHEINIIQIIRECLAADTCRIILFGFRATGKNTSSSDYDIALKSVKPIQKIMMMKIKEKLENSLIPFKVDVVIITTFQNSYNSISTKRELNGNNGRFSKSAVENK